MGKVEKITVGVSDDVKLAVKDQAGGSSKKDVQAEPAGKALVRHLGKLSSRPVLLDKSTSRFYVKEEGKLLPLRREGSMFRTLEEGETDSGSVSKPDEFHNPDTQYGLTSTAAFLSELLERYRRDGDEYTNTRGFVHFLHQQGNVALTEEQLEPYPSK